MQEITNKRYLRCKVEIQNKEIDHAHVAPVGMIRASVPYEIESCRSKNRS